jgi:hypothetical protein
MPTGPTQQAFARSLSYYTGLSYTAALAWTSAEVGGNNNLGIMDAPGKPHVYGTPAQGAQAAAQLINTSPLYAGIRASVGKSPQEQMDAIARSPWHLGPTGLKNAGGLDPYYARIFSSFGYVKSGGTPASKPAGGTATTSVPADGTPFPITFGNASDSAHPITLSFPTGTPITADFIQSLTNTLLSKGAFGGYKDNGDLNPVDNIISTTAAGAFSTALQPLIGKTWGPSIQGQMGGNIMDAAGSQPKGPDIPAVATRLVSFVIAVVLILAGLYLYSRGAAQTVRLEGNAG